MYSTSYKYKETYTSNAWQKSYLKPEKEYFQGVEIDKTYYVVGEKGSIIYSTNGLKWYEIDTNISEDLKYIATTPIQYEYFDDITYSNKMTNNITLVANENKVYISYNLKTWNLLENLPLQGRKIKGIYSDGTYFYIYGDTGLIIRSDNCEVWEDYSLDISSNIIKFKYFNNHFTFLTNNKQVYYGLDLGEFTVFDIEYQFNDFTYFKDKYYACGDNGLLKYCDLFYEWFDVEYGEEIDTTNLMNLTCLNSTYNVKIGSDKGIYCISNNKFVPATYKLNSEPREKINFICDIDYNTDDIEEITIDYYSIQFISIGKEILSMNYEPSSNNTNILVYEHKGTSLDVLLKQIVLSNMNEEESLNYCWIEDAETGNNINLISPKTIIKSNENLFILNKTIPLKNGDKLYYKSNQLKNSLSLVYNTGD